MSITIHFRIFLGILIVSICSASSAAEYAEGALGYDWNPDTKQFKRVSKEWQEGIVFDDASGNYFVTYKDGYGEYNEVIFEPVTKIAPRIRSKVKQRDLGAIQYEYEVENGKSGKQAINLITVQLRTDIHAQPSPPAGWETHIVNDAVDNIARASWSFRGDGGGLAPSRALSGFWLEAPGLPGVVQMEFRGDKTKGTVWLAHYPTGTIGKQMQEIEKNNFVPRLAAVPRIPVPTPWDTGTVLANIRTHLNTDIVPMQLIDPVFANELNRLFTAAIEAVKHNNDKGVKENLKDIRKALKKAHRDMEDEDGDEKKHNDNRKSANRDWESTDPKQKPKPATIDRLAARVLDFDVKYVLRRLGNDEKD